MQKTKRRVWCLLVAGNFQSDSTVFSTNHLVISAFCHTRLPLHLCFCADVSACFAHFEVLSTSVQRPSANCNSACHAWPCCGKQNLLRSMLRYLDALLKLLTDLLQDSHDA